MYQLFRIRLSSRLVFTALVCPSKLLLVRSSLGSALISCRAVAGNLKRELAHAMESEDETSDPESSDQGQQTSGESRRPLILVHGDCLLLGAVASLERKAVGIFHSKKSKTKAKTGGLSQIEILKSMGIPDEEIPKVCWKTPAGFGCWS